MTTFTASMAHGSEPLTNHTGMQHVSSSVTAADATGTASSVFLLAKIPNGATIYGWDILGTMGSDTNTLKIGTSATESCLTTDFSLSATLAASHQSRARAALLPLTISLSDDAEPRFVWIQATAIVDICATASMQFNIWYKTDGSRSGITER